MTLVAYSEKSQINNQTCIIVVTLTLTLGNSDTLAIAVLPVLVTLRQERATTLRMGAPKPTGTLGNMNSQKLAMNQPYLINITHPKLTFPN